MNLLEMSLSASVLILAIAVIRAPLLHRLPKKTFLALWEAALCRLLIPFSIPSRFSVFTVADMLKSNSPEGAFSSAQMPAVAVNPAVTENIPALAETAERGISPVWIVWLIGLTFCVLFFLVTHLYCRKEYKTALPVDNAFVKRWKHEHPTRRNVQFRQSDKIAAALTYGLFRPVVLLPKQIDWTDETRLRYILTHEYVHIRRFDILTKLLLAAVLSIHWFNPFVWLMYLLANRDIELSCDEAVVRTFGETVKSAYALTLIKLEEQKSRIAPLVNSFGKNAIEERIVSIMKFKKASAFCIVCAVCLVIGITAVFATSCQRGEPNLGLPEKYDRQYISELEQGHHAEDSAPQTVLMEYISEQEYDFNNFELKLDEDMKKTYVYPDGNIEIQLTAYDIETSNGDVVRVWDAQPYYYYKLPPASSAAESGEKESAVNDSLPPASPAAESGEKEWVVSSVNDSLRYSSPVEAKDVAWELLDNNEVRISSEEQKAVYAAADGVAIVKKKAGWSPFNYVLISHGSSIYSVYRNLDNFVVEFGEEVKKGQKLGEMNEENGHYSFRFGLSQDGKYLEIELPSD